MAASGNPFDGPSACPFVALELDRDRRSERPDYRHRCFAEPTPAPRSIAHQEAYCLSPTFSACPIFQDWALRAAARPVGAPAPDVPADAQVVVTAAAAASVTASEPPIEDELPPIEDELPPIEEELPPIEDELPPLAPLAPAVAAQQLGAFDEPQAQTSLPGALTAPEIEVESPWDEPAADYPDELPGDAEAPGYVPPPARRDDPTPLPEEAAVPAFLAGRTASQRPSTALPPPQSLDRVTREDLVPSWEIDGRYGAEGPEDPGGGGSRFDNILTAIAVIAILALGVAGVLFLPGLLAGGPGAGSRTPAPSIVRPSGLPSSEPSLLPTLGPSIAPQTAGPTAAPTAEPTPEASPRFYRIRSGDTLVRIARRFDTTVEAILAANPEISDPNDIFAGQVIIIPQP